MFLCTIMVVNTQVVTRDENPYNLFGHKIERTVSEKGHCQFLAWQWSENMNN